MEAHGSLYFGIGKDIPDHMNTFKHRRSTANSNIRVNAKRYDVNLRRVAMGELGLQLSSCSVDLHVVFEAAKPYTVAWHGVLSVEGK